MRNELLILRVLVIILIVLTLISLFLDIWILLRKPAAAETHLQGKNQLTLFMIDLTTIVH